jgi:hypothetical protein
MPVHCVRSAPSILPIRREAGSSLTGAVGMGSNPLARGLKFGQS